MKIKENELIKVITSFIPFTIKKIKEDSYFKNMARVTQAKVVGFTNTDETSPDYKKTAIVVMPFDTVTFNAKVNTTDTIDVGDNVFLLYWGDLKNAHVVFKN